MPTALRVFAVAWALLAAGVVVLVSVGPLLPPGLWQELSTAALLRLAHVNEWINAGVLLLVLPAVIAALSAAWLGRRVAVELDAERIVALTRQLQDAAAATSDAAGRHFMRMLAQFFDRSPDGTMKPKVVRVQVDDERYVLVPLVSLVPKVSYTLDTLRVRFRCALPDGADGAEAAKQLESLHPGAVTATAVPPKRGAKRHLLDVTLEIRPGEPAEAVADLLRALEPTGARS
jgi:hypothetical protein